MLINAFPQGKKDKPIVTEEITSSKTWTVPEGVHQVEVMLFGGGGAGYKSGTFYGGGGGSGYMNRGKFYVTPGQQIAITIGAGATDYSSDGGTTSFGDMLSANGGQSGVSYKGGDGFAGGGGYADSSQNVPYRFAGHGVGGGDGGWHGYDTSKLFKGVSTATAQGGEQYVSSSSSGSRAGGGGGGMNGGNGGKGGPDGGGGGGGYGIKKLTSGTSGGTGYGAGGGSDGGAGAPGICVLKHALPIGGQIFSPAMSPTSFKFTSSSSSGTINVTGLSPTATIKLEIANTAFKVGGTNTVGGTATVTDGKIIVKAVASWSGTRTAMVAVEDNDSLAFYTQKYFTITVTM